MIEFYFNASPSSMKVALLLEETGLAYAPRPVDVCKGEQFTPVYLAINPNAKVPAIIDDGVTVFDSNAILLYLAEKTKRFLSPSGPAPRAALLSWLMFAATGVGPFSGQAAHFKHFAPEPMPYALGRYMYEARRHNAILDARLAEGRYMLGDCYTIVDMAVWGWARMAPFILGDAEWAALGNLRRHFDEISARPAAIRAVALKDRHVFTTQANPDSRQFMYRHTVVQAG